MRGLFGGTPSAYNNRRSYHHSKIVRARQVRNVLMYLRASPARRSTDLFRMWENLVLDIPIDTRARPRQDAHDGLDIDEIVEWFRLCHGHQKLRLKKQLPLLWVRFFDGNFAAKLWTAALSGDSLTLASDDQGASTKKLCPPRTHLHDVQHKPERSKSMF